jgi:hypothetical protein
MSGSFTTTAEETSALVRLDPWLDIAASRIEEARRVLDELGDADAILDHLAGAFEAVSEERPDLIETWRIGDSEEGRVLRRLERVRAARRDLALDGPAKPPPPFLTVKQLAAGIGLSEATTYGLLERGLIPGARKADPSRPKSHWVIQPIAIDLYLASKEA